MRDDSPGAQQYILYQARRMMTGQCRRLTHDVVEEGWPARTEPVFIVCDFDPSAPLASTEPSASARFMTSEQRMALALGSDFDVEFRDFDRSYVIRRIAMKKFISRDDDPMKQGTSRTLEPLSRARKPTAKRVKSDDRMKETPLSQRFSQLDLD